jgi:PAS domain S-box-containing protein
MANPDGLTYLNLSNEVEQPGELLALIDSIPALVASVDCNMVLQFCNQPFKSWFHLEETITGLSFPQVVGKQVFDQVQRHMGRVLVGQSAHFQILVTTTEGLRYLDATLSPGFDSNGKVKGFIFHSSDVTEKTRTERALRDYFENASICLHWVDEHGKIVWANSAELKTLGYTNEEYIGHHISEFHVRKDVIHEMLHRLGNKEALENYEADLLCKDGSVRHSIINSTVLWEGDKFIHTRCFTVDVTERKRAAIAVKESGERFKTMANLVPLTIWTTNKEGDCDYLSVKWTETTGKPVSDGLLLGWCTFIHNDDREKIRLSWLNSLTFRRPFEAKFRFLSADGEYRVNYANATPMFNNTGSFEGYIGIFQDISSDEHVKSTLERIVLDRTQDLRTANTDLKSAENALKMKNAELEKINEQLTSFAHIASHDLQEPLRKIQILSGLLFQHEGNQFSARGKDLYDRITSSTERMRNLIHDLLTYSKTDSKGNLEPVDLNLLFKEVIGELEMKIGEKNALVSNLGLPVVSVVRFQFHQLFLNLLGNAIKFSREDTVPEIVVSYEVLSGNDIPDHMRELGSVYRIRFADNGIGFDPEDSEKVFKMFHRLHTRNKYEGTGIGLAICKRIVENHRGTIVAEGSPQGGATFHIYLPVT